MVMTKKERDELAGKIREFTENYPDGCDDQKRAYLRGLGDEIGIEIVPKLGEVTLEFTVTATFDVQKLVDEGYFEEDEVEEFEEQARIEVEDTLNRYCGFDFGSYLDSVDSKKV